MGVCASFQWIFFILVLACLFGHKKDGQCEATTVNYRCPADSVILVSKAYSCTDNRCSKKLYDSLDVQDVWSSCNMKNSCDVTLRHLFLIMQHDCVLPDKINKGDICGAERLIINPGSGAFFLHNPGYPGHTGDMVSCTCAANLSHPVSVTMRYLHADIPDDSLHILWDNSGGSPNGSSEILTATKTLELMYQPSNLSTFWIQMSVNVSFAMTCENEYPIVILPTVPSSTLAAAVLPSGIRIWIIVGATSGVICIFIILIPVVVIFACRHRKRRAAKLKAWNEMVEKAAVNVHGNPTTIQRGTDRIRKIPLDGQTVNLYQSVDEMGTLDGSKISDDSSGWELVVPSKRNPGALSLNRPKHRSLPPEPEPKDTPYYIYETLPKDSSKKHHPYQAIDEFESEEGSPRQMKVNDLYESKESVGRVDHEDDWNELYQMVSTLGRDSTSPEADQWKSSAIYECRDNIDDGKLAPPGVGRSPSRSPNSGRVDSGRGTLNQPQKTRDKHANQPSSDEGTAKFPHFPAGTYDNARDIKPKQSDSSGYDNCDPDEEWLEEKEREKERLEAAFHDIGKTLTRLKDDIEVFKTLKTTRKKTKPKRSSPDDVYEVVP